MKKIILCLCLFLFGVILVSCDNTPKTINYTVSFDTDGGSVVLPQVVKNGSKVSRPINPTKENYSFNEWYNGSFKWNFDVDIVKEDITLKAHWLSLTSNPTEIGMSNDPFSSTIVWRAAGASSNDVVVSIKSSSETVFSTIEGTIVIDDSNEMNYVSFTPTITPLGGEYSVKITSNDVDFNVDGTLLFGGNGTLDNPYLVSKPSDLIGLVSDASYSSAHFKQIKDISSTLSNPITINDDRKITFSGVYDGGNYSLSFTGNGGLFHEITASGVVKNINIPTDSVVITSSDSNTYPVGAISDINQGLIENVTSRAMINDPHLQGSLTKFTTVPLDGLYGCGSVVGKNTSTGIIRNVTVSGAGSVKAGRGAGGVASWNYGLIEEATVSATLPAGNNANSGNSSNTYSFCGGITGFNFGTIRKSSVSGRVFGQSAWGSVNNKLINVAFGGITGYNSELGVIDECSFARAMTSKEYIAKNRAEELGDNKNNLGVASIHGDAYIGGIAGINDGLIQNVYVGGALIGGRDYIGGISGLTGSSSIIKNSYVFAELAVKDVEGVKVNVASDLTTLSIYNIAPSGYDESTTFYKPLLNSITNAIWVPGALEAPIVNVFTSDDLAKVGNKFNQSGLLLWQTGAVTNVDIVLEHLMIGINDVVSVDYVVYPDTAPDTYTTWSSDNPAVVQIVGPGSIKGISAGTAIITVTTRDGNFTDSIEVEVADYIHADSVIVSSPEFVLPTPNDASDRKEIEIGTTISFEAIFSPDETEFKGFSLVSSNSRATVSGHTVTFVVGSGAGNVSITITFEDSSLSSLEFRFKTIPSSVIPDGVPISSVVVNADTITLPQSNLSTDRQDIEVDTVFTLSIDILPENATNKNYVISSSQLGIATVSDHTVTVIGLGSFSIKLTFEDTSVGNSGVLEYRFNGTPASIVPTEASVTVSSDFDLFPEPGNDTRVALYYDTVIVLTLEFEGTDITTYTITVTNGRLIVVGNVITVRNSGPGNVSITIKFDDPSLPDLTYNFITVEN
ncbi:MAG: InlB B-repeat-containing protein [Acholeplasmatales bacterium]|jgi:uncharacterized repeat protein (TIGR02543 family)|nr:InlB B-repeat-containing protein [Acholeplasmatales bacterium]